MIFSKKSHDGEIFVDHRASPGIPPELAVKLGYHPDQVKGGTIFEGATLGCPHGGACVVMNPLRTRERAHCFQCNMYICDWCDAARQDPNYVHRTIHQIRDMVSSGKFEISGGNMHRPVITKTGES